MVNTLDREVGNKNISLQNLNQRAGNVYHYSSQGTPRMEVVANDKYRKSASGPVPDEVVVDEQQAWTQKDWLLTLGVAAGVLLAFYLLLKYKVITI